MATPTINGLLSINTPMQVLLQQANERGINTVPINDVFQKLKGKFSQSFGAQGEYSPVDSETQTLITQLQDKISANSQFQDLFKLNPQNQRLYDQINKVFPAAAQSTPQPISTTPPPSPPPGQAPGPTPPPGAKPPPPGNIDPVTGGVLAGGTPTGLTGTNPDQGIINSTGSQQYGQTQQFIEQDAAARAAARSALAKALTGQLEDQFKFNLPGTLEDLNQGHLLTSSALPQEIARQQGNIAAQVAGQTGVLGAQDIATTSAQRAAALQNLQGFGTAGINRNFSLADFEKQSQLAQTLGAQAAPQVGGGKGAVGTGLSGLGVAAPLAGLAFPGAAPALLATGAASSAAANNARGSGK